MKLGQNVFGLTISLGFLWSASLASAATNVQRTCTLKARGAGKDDSPTFVSTVRDAACSTVVIPQHTTLNLSTKVDLTGVENKHIVSGFNQNSDSLD